MEQQRNKQPESQPKWKMLALGIVPILYIVAAVSSMIEILDPLVEIDRQSAATSQMCFLFFLWTTIIKSLKLEERYPRLCLLVYITLALAFIYMLLVNREIIAPLHLPF